MDILMTAIVDYANLGYGYCKALRTIGIDVVMVKTTNNNRDIRYPEEAIICDIDFIKSLIPTTKIIQYCHSQYINLGKLKNKRVFTMHGGSKFRLHSKDINKIFNPISEGTIIQTADLLNLGAKNESWILPPVDINCIKPKYERTSDKIIIGHFPTSTRFKGTEVINKLMEKICEEFKDRIQYNFSEDIIIWSENVNRISDCDIYIEALCPRQKGRRYGEWGLSCLEASSAGTVVITHSTSMERYRKEYGECPLNIANTSEELESKLRRLINMKDNELLNEKKIMRDWVENLHNYEVIGRRLEKFYGKI